MTNKLATSLLEQFTTIKKLSAKLTPYWQSDKTIGFIPSLGALHQGHLSLIKRSLDENHITVVSIFVNPTQFNEKEDFLKYPRETEQDIALLKEVNCDILFLPTKEEIYGPSITKETFDFGVITNLLEGAHRPGHFDGVIQIVKRLLGIVNPNKLYMGQKDFQQVAVIKKLIRDFGLGVDLVPCPTIREKNGLAMSSRNERLSSEQREHAAILYKTLLMIRESYMKEAVSQSIEKGTKAIEEQGLFSVEYLAIVNEDTLEPLKEDEKGKVGAVICVAARIGGIRLIDNVHLPNETTC